MRQIRICALLLASISLAAPLYGQAGGAASNAASQPAPSSSAMTASGAAAGDELPSAPNPAPLSVGGKWRLYYRQTISPMHFLGAGVGAGINQAQDHFPEYGQGMEGYGKRYGQGFADSSLGAFFGGFLLPSLMHDDPRYHRLGSGSIVHRAIYAFSRELITRHDDGTRRPNIARLLGNFMGCAVGNLYYPEQERGAGTTFQRGAQVSLGNAISYGFREFWPDIRTRVFKSKVPEF